VSGLQGTVVVLTGASSGIGRATAHELARQGASVVLTARREGPLQELAAELGERALAVPADVTDPAQVEEVARRAVERFGGIDVWVNNAAVTAFGRFEALPAEAFARVIEVNLLGYVNGARAALPHLRRRRGTLVNVGSVNSHVGAPFVSPYVASKFAIRGWAEALREELRADGVAVCTVKPASIDTPLFQHAGNWTGREPKALDPVNPPERVARRIAAMARRPRRETVVGRGGRQLLVAHGLVPPLFERAFAKVVEHNHFLDRPAPASPGNLFAPVPFGTAPRGGWLELARRRTARRAAVAAGATAAALAGAVAARRR
jgi:NAD(P)-dependent dehydrogenase (short-subunit alcohol dehydrogenase family)